MLWQSAISGPMSGHRHCHQWPDVGLWSAICELVTSLQRCRHNGQRTCDGQAYNLGWSVDLSQVDATLNDQQYSTLFWLLSSATMVVIIFREKTSQNRKISKMFSIYSTAIKFQKSEPAAWKELSNVTSMSYLMVIKPFVQLEKTANNLPIEAKQIWDIFTFFSSAIYSTDLE